MNRLALVSVVLCSSASMVACALEPELHESHELHAPQGPLEPALQELSSAGEITPLCVNNLVPALTGPSSAVFRSAAFSSAYEAWQAFDNVNSMWISGHFQTPAWIGYDFVIPQLITGYAINFSNGAPLATRAPRDWTFEGWNGLSWVVLDTRAAQTGWLGTQRREYLLPSTSQGTSYPSYRLHVTDDNDTRAGIVTISMNRLELLSCPF